MKSSYKALGNYITEVSNRNSGLRAKELLGINIDKFFMPSVANVIGTDLSVYKVVKFNQFACNRMHVGRDHRLPVAISKRHEEFIVSPAYDVFEIIDTNILDPDYLMMWFMRSEFDRNAWFYTDADVRGGLSWNAFCEMLIPIPSIKKQRALISEYNVIQDRILLNKELIKNLEELMQIVFKQWFLEFDFPDQNGVPYKTGDGNMVWSDILKTDVPLGWEVSALNAIKDSTLGGDWGKDQAIGNYTQRVYCMRGTDIPASSHGQRGNIPTRYILQNNLNARKLESSDIVLEISGGSPTQSTGRSVYISSYYLKNLNQPIICSNFCRVLKSRKGYSEYMHCALKYLYRAGILFKYENSSNGVKNLALDDVLKEEIFAIPPPDVINKFTKIHSELLGYISVLGIELEKAHELRSLILSKIATTKE